MDDAKDRPGPGPAGERGSSAWSGADEGGRGPVEPAEQLAPEADLGRTDWLLTEIRDPRSGSLLVPSGIVATATFADGRIMGSTGCNRYVGTCTVDGAGMRITGVASTMRACPPPESDVELAFTAAIGRVAGYVVRADGLELMDDAGSTLLLFVPRPSVPLIGTAWSAIAVNDGRGGVRSLVVGSAISLSMGDDGTIAGDGGCNRYHGPFALSPGRLRIGPLATTRMACPAPLMDQEAAFLAALSRVETFAIDGDRLELRSEDGALQAEFRVAGS